MNKSSIKNKIILNFFTSCIQAFIITIISFISFFGFVHIISNNMYVKLLEMYNKDYRIIILYTIILFSIFITLMYILFSKKMGKITDYLVEISRNIGKVSEGNLNINIPVKTDDELGELADSINKMSYNLSELMKREKEWDIERANLITNLSHDLRTPLTSILGFLGLIKKEAENNEKLNHYCNITLNKAEELKYLINQLFEFTKITNSDFKLNTVEISLQELAEQVLISFTPEFEFANMEYRILSENRNIKIEADPPLLMRVFENIITNSIKYGYDGKYLDVNIDEDNEYAFISFVNYGEPIKEDINNLFNKYYRSKKICDKKEGTGLGLTIVKTIIELHGGDIIVLSKEDKTKFKFKFKKFI